MGEDKVGVHYPSGGEEYWIVSTAVDYVEICFSKVISSKGLWRAQNPLTSGLPVLVVKLIGVMLVTSIVRFAFKPLHQPRVIAEILAGFIMGTNVRTLIWPHAFPPSGTVTHETVANFALVYHMFLLGLELDLKPIKRAGKTALSVALVGIVFSVVVGWALFRHILFKDFHKETKGRLTKDGPIFWGIALANTNFPDVARILANLKLFYSDVGGVALSASLISDLCCWIILLLAMPVFNNTDYFLPVASTLVFIGVSIFVVRPALVKIIERENSQADRNYNVLTCFVLAGAVLFGLITDACGSHSIVGPYVLGAIIPKGEFKSTLANKVGNFVPVMLMPFFFYVTGGRVKYSDILNKRGSATGTNMNRVLAVVIIASASKIMSTFFAALINKMSPRDSLALGVLMNAKGVLTLIILNSARDLKILNKQTFAISVVSVWVMTFAVGPFLAFVYKSSAKLSARYKQRNVQSMRPNSELRILACSHASQNVSGIINLIDSSNPNIQSPIHVLALHLVELTGNSSAMLVVHDACKSSNTNMTNNVHDHSVDNESSTAFELYAQQRENVTVQKLTAVSAYSTMHEDICNLAEDNRVTLIIIPFHKQSVAALDESRGMEESKKSYLERLNDNLIANARCSVGVFVDRGFGASSNYSNSRRHIAMLFIGGVDDREALAYAGRMAGHPKVFLTVIQFKITSTKEMCSEEDDDDGILDAMTSTAEQKDLDDLYMDEFRLWSTKDSSIDLLEKSVTNWEQILTLVNSIEGDYEMFIVGRRHGNTLELSTTLYNNLDELGFFGDALLSATVTASPSILVMQQGGQLDHDS